MIGIQYDLIHPEPIHSLPNGLTLYKSKLAPHEPGFNAAIGGPHTSFDFCCNAVGGAHRAVALFAQQIELYKSGEWSAPRITTYPMTREELTFAKDMAEFGCDLDTLNKVGELEACAEEFFDQFEEVHDLGERQAIWSLEKVGSLSLQWNAVCVV